MNKSDFSPFWFERLYNRLGEPRYFWECVMACVFLLYVLGSSVAADALA